MCMCERARVCVCVRVWMPESSKPSEPDCESRLCTWGHACTLTPTCAQTRIIHAHTHTHTHIHTYVHAHIHTKEAHTHPQSSCMPAHIHTKEAPTDPSYLHKQKVVDGIPCALTPTKEFSSARQNLRRSVPFRSVPFRSILLYFVLFVFCFIPALFLFCFIFVV